MESKNSYDLLVIGVGMAGVSVAHKAARSGRRVAVVDSRPYGGTCALRGCDPKKVLVGAAELIDWSRRMSGSGVEGALTIDWSALMKHKESIIEGTPGSLEQSMSKLGLETLHGAARFIGRHTVMVNDRKVDAEHIVIAAGNILKGNRKHPDNRGTPSVAFTVPSLARVVHPPPDKRVPRGVQGNHRQDNRNDSRGVPPGRPCRRDDQHLRHGYSQRGLRVRSEDRHPRASGGYLGRCLHAVEGEGAARWKHSPSER